MIALLQRVTQAGVSVDGHSIASIGGGILALVAVVPTDAEPQANANTANTANAASAQQIRGPAAGANPDAEFPEVSARPTEPASSKPTPHA